MNKKWAYEEINGLINHYLKLSLEWLESGDSDTAYRFLSTAIKLREIK